MVDAIQFQQAGGPEVLQLVQIDLSLPGPGEVRLRQTAVGLNYIDVYHRSGYYHVKPPAIPGLEAAGIIESVGEGVTEWKAGDRVAYGRGPLGAYATARNIAAKELLKLPDNVTEKTAASAMLKGMTAWYLLYQTYPVRKGDVILVHAAAGGVGLLLCQWAKQLGCRVIGTVGSEEKGELAKTHGCDEVIFYRREDVAKRVRELTNGEGVPVVYDAVGKTTFIASLDSLAPMGMMVTYGQASGPIPPFDLQELAKRHSLYISRPSLADYMKPDKVYREAGEAVLQAISSGTLRVNTAQEFALKDAANAHRALQARETSGSTILIP